MQGAPSRIRVAVVHDYELVVLGLAQMFSGSGHFCLVDLDSLSDPTQYIDIALVDMFESPGRDNPAIARLLDNPRIRKLVVYTWDMHSDRVQSALRAGVAGYVSKSLGRRALLDALWRVHNGETVVHPLSKPDLLTRVDGVAEAAEAPGLDDNWPGKDHGLTPREAETLALITQGVTNDEIAKTLFLSINSVKSYIRSAYQKIGVERRSQAILWGLEHGLQPRAVIYRLDTAGR